MEQIFSKNLNNVDKNTTCLLEKYLISTEAYSISLTALFPLKKEK